MKTLSRAMLLTVLPKERATGVCAAGNPIPSTGRSTRPAPPPLTVLIAKAAALTAKSIMRNIRNSEQMNAYRAASTLRIA